MIFVFLGGIFGSFEVTTVAFTKEEGVAEAAGALLALYAVGSLLAGLIFGALALRSTLVRQFVVAIVVLAVVTAPLPFLDTVWLVAIGLFVAGIACSPVLISGFALIERDRARRPADRIDGVGEFRPGGGDRPRVAVRRRDHRHLGAQVAYWVTSGCAFGALARRGARRPFPRPRATRGSGAARRPGCSPSAPAAGARAPTDRARPARRTLSPPELPSRPGRAAAGTRGSDCRVP